MGYLFRYRFYFWLTALLAMAGPSKVSAQLSEGLQLYGYFQGGFRHTIVDSNPRLGPRRANTFDLQQLNLFLFKQFNARLSAFINTEYTNAFSTRDGWGGMKLEEAWMKYDEKRWIRVKAGLLIPTFNNLNTIKNKTPLLPYIFRPLAYETAFEHVLSLSEYTPRQAAIEVYGVIPVSGGLKLDYAMYVGNQDGFVITEDVGTHVSGTDTTLAKLWGGRVGIRQGSVKVGISATTDHSNQSVLRTGAITYDGIGTVGRNRLGFDISVHTGMWFGEAEFIDVKYTLEPSQERELNTLAQSNPFLNSSLEKRFYYALLGRNWGDRFYSYLMYAFMRDDSNVVMEKGYGTMSLGGGFRVRESAVLKLQWNKTDSYLDSIFFVNLHDIKVSLSIFI